MNKRIILLSSVILLSACNSTPHKIKASDSEVKSYFDNLVIKPQNGEVKHDKHGTIAATQTPYITDYNECLNHVFSGQSFMFGGIKINDPQKLEQYSDDYLMHKLAFIMPKNGRRDATIRPVFDDESFKENLDKIRSLKSEVLACTKNKGWSYLPSKK